LLDGIESRFSSYGIEERPAVGRVLPVCALPLLCDIEVLNETSTVECSKEEIREKGNPKFTFPRKL